MDAKFAIGEHQEPLFDIAKSVGLSREQVIFMQSFAAPEIEPSEGFCTDFCGSRVRIKFLGRWGDGLDNVRCTLPVPGGYTGEAGEWLGVFKAVAAARDSFSIMELGAGYGPWLGIAGVCALRRGINDLYFCGVEGDPIRASWMGQHLIDNGLGDCPQDLISAAVGVDAGVARWPRLDAPADHTGARPLQTDADKGYLGAFFDLNDMIEVDVVPFSELLDRRSLWDIVHMDVQGSELELCDACRALLRERVRYLVVGTHWRSIEGNLMDLMLREGWFLEYERPAVMKCPVYPDVLSLFHHTVVDGVQVWRNPRIS